MTILEKFVPFVNEQIIIQEKLSKKFSATEWRKNLHLQSSEQFKELLSAIEQADRDLELSTKLPITKVPIKKRLTLTTEELDGLPDELLKELSSATADKSEYAIMQLLGELGGIASLDQILVGHFRKSNEVYKRNTLVSKLYRMAQKGLVSAVPGKKGVYSTTKITEDEVKNIVTDEPVMDEEFI